MTSIPDLINPFDKIELLATEESKLPRISFSQLNSWDRCEEAWNYSYKLGWRKREQKDYLDIGLVAHKMLARYYEDCVRVHCKTPENCHFKYVEELIGTGDSRIQVISRAAWLVQHYIKSFAPFEDVGHVIVKVEQELIVPLTSPNGLEFELVGIYDLLTHRQGKYWLWDHKTSTRFWTPIQAMMDSQMPMYCAALQETGIEVFGIIINMLNTYDYKNPETTDYSKLFRREKTYRTSKEIESIKFHVGLAVEKKWEAQNDPDWIPRKSLKKDCDQCAFQEPCLFSIKGIDPTDVFRANYTQKDKR